MYIKLITKDIREKLLENERRQQEGESGLAMRPVVKLFTPDAAANWVFVSAEEVGDDLIMFGWCDLGLGFPEFGYASLNKLQTVRGKLGLPVERDRFFTTDRPLEDWANEQCAHQNISL